MHARRTAVAGVSLAIALALAGCTAAGQTTTGTPPPKATAAPAASSSAAPATLTGTAMGYSCDQLLDATSISAYDSTLVATPGYSPADGSSAATAKQLQGTVCEWTGANDTLVVTAAHPDAASQATLIARATANGDPSQAFGTGVTAFTLGNEIQVFTPDGFWATAVSAVPSTDPASVTLIHDVLEALPAG